MTRGQITPEIAQNRLGINFSKLEIRLIPYIMHCIHNSIKLDKQKLNRTELAFTRHWEEEKLVKIIQSDSDTMTLRVTENFYDFMATVMKYSYAQDYIIKECDICSKQVENLSDLQPVINVLQCKYNYVCEECK